VPEEAPAQPPKKPPRSARQVWREWGRPLLIFFVVTSVFRSSVGDWNDVPTASMEPNILPGDRIWVNKVAYDLKVPFTTLHLLRWSDPRSGDIVVFFSPADGVRMVKRVIGRPGDEVMMAGNEIVINGRRSRYSPQAPPEDAKEPAFWDEYHHYFLEQRAAGANLIQTTPFVRARKWFPRIKVPEEHYLVLGDNRDQSADYRSFGFVPRSAIVGRATSVVLSFDRQAGWKPRWGRFFTGLE